MKNVVKIALTVLCTFSISCAFAQCRPGSPCYQGNNRGDNSGYSYDYQYDQQPQGYQQRAQMRGQAQGQQQGQMKGQHPTGEPSHYYKGLPVYMEGNAQPPAGAQMTPPAQAQAAANAATGAQVVSPTK